jgi:hypothetical protein
MPLPPACASGRDLSFDGHLTGSSRTNCPSSTVFVPGAAVGGCACTLNSQLLRPTRCSASIMPEVSAGGRPKLPALVERLLPCARAGSAGARWRALHSGWQIPPRCAGSQYPHDSFENGAGIGPRSAGTGHQFFDRDELLQIVPLMVGEVHP